MRKTFSTVSGAIATAALLILMNAGVASAAQPFASCQDPGAVLPAGFNTAGFAHAGTVYAGSDGTHSLVSNNPHAVSQYDIACFGGH
jgi:hypothetical protein